MGVAMVGNSANVVHSKCAKWLLFHVDEHVLHTCMVVALVADAIEEIYNTHTYQDHINSRLV